MTVKECNLLFDGTKKTIKAILTDYAAREGLEIELEEAFEQLRNECISSVEDEDFDELLNKLKGIMPLEEDHSKELLKQIDEDLIEELKDEAIEKYNEGHATIKIVNIGQAEKLEEFVTREIWPHYNEAGNWNI